MAIEVYCAWKGKLIMTVDTEYDDDLVVSGIPTVIPVNTDYVGLNNLPAEVAGPIRKVMEASDAIAYPVTSLNTLEGRVTGAPENNVPQIALDAGIAGNPIRQSIYRPRSLLEAALEARLAAESPEEIQEAQQFLSEVQEQVQNMPYSDEVLDMDHLEIAQKAKGALDFPDLAKLIMRTGIEMENRTTREKIMKYKKEADACRAKMDKLLKLSAELPRMNTDDGSYALKEEVKGKILQLAKELKEDGIDIFPGSEIGGEITKEQLAAANSLINHHIDQIKTTLQELFTTKISVSIQFLQMMNEVMKKISELDDRAKKKAIEEARR
jgi:hypothetical protein